MAAGGSATRDDQAPTGPVTIVFTDVQGSTSLWERSPETARRALVVHSEIARRAIAEAGGYEVKTEGDSFMVAFADPLAAVRWCLVFQERLCQAAWPEDLDRFADSAVVATGDGRVIFRGLRVRMGLHAGLPDCRRDPTSKRMDYFGPMVNRTARVASAAHGGQILVSGAVWEEIRGALDALGSPFFLDLGEHRLRGIESTERLVMLLPQSLAERTFPRPRTLDVRLTNLPAHPGTFVGRAKDIEDLDALVRGGARVITLTGPGGIGKTRLAERFGAFQLEGFSAGGGVWFVDLAQARDCVDVCAQIGEALGFVLPPGVSDARVIQSLGNSIAERKRTLLILDNFEQVVEQAAPMLADLVKCTPEAVFLVTSRRSLGIEGEAIQELVPLGLPADDASAPASEAVELFVARCRSARRAFDPTAADYARIVGIVKRLDGMPLALELAAARTRTLTLAELQGKIEKRFDLLVNPNRDAPPRHATVERTLDWSWDLLEPWEREAFVQCAAFRKSFSHDAAEHVIDLREFADAPSVFDVVTALVEQSILHTVEARGASETRFAMYVPVHEYAAARLAVHPRRSKVLVRHAEYFAGLGRELVPKTPGGGSDQRIHRIAAESENFGAVLERFAGADAHGLGGADRARLVLEAVLALDPLLTMRGPFVTRLANLDRAIAFAEIAGADPSLLAWAREARCRARTTAGDTTGSEQDIRRGIAEARRASDGRAEATILRNLALIEHVRGELDASRIHYEESLALFTRVGDRLGRGFLLEALGTLYLTRGEIEKAIGYHSQARDIGREAGSQPLQAHALMNLGICAQELGRFETSIKDLRAAVEIAEALGDGRIGGYCVGYLGCAYHEMGDPLAAQEQYARAIQILADVGEKHQRAFFWSGLGAAHAQRRDYPASEAAFRNAADLLAGSKEASLVRALAICRAVPDACRAQDLARAGDAEGARRLLDATRRVLDGDAATAHDESDDVRFARRLLKSEIARPSPTRERRLLL